MPNKKLPLYILIVLTSFTYLCSVLILPHTYTRQWKGEPPTFPVGMTPYYQFNRDVPGWVRYSSEFPASLNASNLRINRPVYLAVSAIAPRILHPSIKLADLDQEKEIRLLRDITFIWMLLLNYLLAVSTVLLFYRWLLKYWDHQIAFSAAILLSLSTAILVHSMRASPEVAATFGSIMVIYLFDIKLMSEDHPSWRRIFIVAICIGLLFFIKANYHVMFTILLWSLYLKRFRIFVGILVFHWIPLIAWILFLPLIGAEYYNHETHTYRQVVWVIDYLVAGDFFGIIRTGLDFSSTALGAVISTFSPFVLILGSLAYAGNESLSIEMKHIMFFGFFSTIIFLMLILRSPASIMLDLYIILYPLTILSLIEFSKWLTLKFAIFQRQQSLYFVVFTLFVIINTAFTWTYNSVW